MKKLVNYYNKLLEAQKAEQEKHGTSYIRRIENPEGTCDTLWIPIGSGNRCCSVNLNHTLVGFDERGVLWGTNDNCGTPYVIIELPVVHIPNREIIPTAATVSQSQKKLKS